jgi:hypothetical protein
VDVCHNANKFGLDHVPMLSSPQEWNAFVHSVATHDSFKKAAAPGKVQEDRKSVGSDSIQSLSMEWQQPKSVSGVAATKVCWKWQHVISLSRMAAYEMT